MSKGGEISNSASAQTPAQWASAQSNTSIAAWREADILGFSQAQLKALTAAQMSHITVPWAVPAAVWTADTLNAVPLQYWSKFGTRYRVTTNNGVSRITELSQGSGDSASGQCNWFDDLGYSPASGGFAFSPAVIAGISNERIAQIGAGHTASAPQLTPNAGVISASDFNAALTATTASGGSVVTWTISDSETAYMFASGWSNMGAQFMGALTVSQLGAIAHPETALGAAQFAYLSANQLIALSQMDWSKVSAAQLNATTISAFSGLQTNILRAISETTWGGLDKAHTMALNAADIQLLSASTVANMQYLGYALTANVGAVLTVAQVQSIAANCWAQISDSGFLNALSTAALQAIPVSAFVNMADVVLANLDSEHVAALTAHQAANYPLNKLSDASSAFYRDPASLNFADFVASGNVNWRQAPASFIKRLTPEQLHLISPAQFATLSSSALAGLTRSQTQSLTLEQIQSLSASQLSAVTYISRRTDVAQQIFTASVLTQMSLDFWRRVDSDFLNALSVTAFQAITSGQMTVIAADAFNRLDQAHINALTVTQMLALTAAQVGQVNGAYLTLPFLRGVRLEAFKGLVPEQMRRLHDYLFNTVVSNAFSSGNTVELEAAEMQFATLVASIMDGDDGREAWLKQSVDLLIRLQWLDPAAAANLSASDVQNTYATLNWSWMSGSFLNNITTTVFSQLKASNIAQLNVGAVAILNDAHVQVLTATQVAAMSGEQLSAIANLGALQASAVQSLSDAQIAGMTQNWAQINPTFLSHMTARQFMALSPSQFGQLHVAQLAATAIDWRLIAPEQLNALSLTEFSKLCTGSNPAILGTTTGVLLGLGGEQMVILSQAAASYSLAQKNALLNRLFGAFSTEQTDRLIDLMKNDSAEQIVLQSGLVALLAKMDGTTTGINTAIQTLVTLRQMQPSWFSVDNLSNVLSVLSTRYINYLQEYQRYTNAQNLYNYVYSSQYLSELARIRTVVNAKVALAGSTSLALGNLLIMIGVGINYISLAIGTSSNKLLSAKERDALIATASLNAIASIVQGLQLSSNVVMQALIRHYTGEPAQALDEVIVEAFERRLSVEAGQSLQEAIQAPAALPAHNTPSALSTGSSDGDISVVDTASPLSDDPTMLPETQFRAPLSRRLSIDKQEQLRFVEQGVLIRKPLLVQGEQGLAGQSNGIRKLKTSPQLLSVNKAGIAVFVATTDDEIYLTLRANRLVIQKPISHEAMLDTIRSDGQSGKIIVRTLTCNVSNNLPFDKNLRIADSIRMAESGQQNIAAGQYLLSNMERFVYQLVHEAEVTSGEQPAKSVEQLLVRMKDIIAKLFGLPVDRLNTLGGEALMATMQDAIQKVTTSYADFIVDDVVLEATISAEDAKVSHELNSSSISSSSSETVESGLQKTLQILKQRLGDTGNALDKSTVRLSLDRLAQSYTIDAVRHNALQLSKNAGLPLTGISDYITSEFVKLGIPMDSHVAMQARDEILITCLLEHGATISSRSGLVRALITVYKQASSVPTLLDNLTLQSYLYALAEHPNWLDPAHSTANENYPIHGQAPGQWVADVWSSIVSLFKREGISPYENSGAGLTKLAQIALNGALRNKFTQLIPAILDDVLSKNEVLTLLERHPEIIENPDSLPTEISRVVDWHIKRLEENVLKCAVRFSADIDSNHETTQSPVWDNFDDGLMDVSYERALQEAKTILVERVVSAWANTLVRSQGEPQMGWHASAQSLHENIDKWLLAIVTKQGKQAFVPGAFTTKYSAETVASYVTSQGKGAIAQTWSPLHERVVHRLQNMGVDPRYLYSIIDPTPRDTTLTTIPFRSATSFGNPTARPLSDSGPSRLRVASTSITRLAPSNTEQASRQVQRLQGASNPNLTPEFNRLIAQVVAEATIPANATEDAVRGLTIWQLLESVGLVMNTIKDIPTNLENAAEFRLAIKNIIKRFALNNQSVAEVYPSGIRFQLKADEFAAALVKEVRAEVQRQGLQAALQPIDVAELSTALTRQGWLSANEQQGLVQGVIDILQEPSPDTVSLGSQNIYESESATSTPDILDAPRNLGSMNEGLGEARGNAQVIIRQHGIENANFQLHALKITVMNVAMLGFGLFASLVGIAAGIAGFIYGLQSTTLSSQARTMMLTMNGVRVLASAVILVPMAAQIAANVIKSAEVVSQATKLANAGFLISNVIGITTSFAQIGIQIQAISSATDSTSRLIAGMAIFDASTQLILNVVGMMALFLGPIGVAVNLVTFMIAALLPNAATIVMAIKYRQSYDELTSKGLFKEAEVMYLHWQVAAMDASPIVNWTSSIYTAEMKKAQVRTMDNAWMDKSAQERLLYSLTNNTELKDNFDSLRAQIYAGAAALNQSFVNLGQGLTRAVTLMLSQDNLSYFEGNKLATVKQAATFNYMTNTVSRAPKLVSAAVNGQLVTLTFNQNLASRNSQLPNLSAFTVKVAGVATTVSGFSLLNNTITLTLASAVSAGQVVTFSYSNTKTGNDSHAVQNLLGKNAASITDHAVVNLLDADHRAPLLVDAVVEDKYLSLLFDEGLDSAVGKVPDKTAFTVTIAGNNAAIQSVAVSGQRVLLTLVDKVAVGEVVSFNYTASEQGLRDTAGNKVAALSAQAVDNTSSTATVSASRVGWLQYDNFVASTQGTGSEAASVLNGADYTVYANDAGAKAGTARLRYLSLSNAVGEFDMYSASRATENSDRIWLDASSAQGLSNFAINTSGMTVWGGQGKNSYSLSRQYANSSYIVAANSWSSDSNVVSLSGGSSDSNHVVNLDYLLTADNISGGLAVAQTPFKVLGSADGLDEVIGSADNQTYYATSNVANVRLTGANANLFVGESATVNVGLNARVLVDMDMWRGLSLSRPTAGVTNATINGNYGSYSLLNLAATDTVNDSFIGKLDWRYQIGHLPALGAFTVNAGGANVAVTQMKISGNKVTLSLASAVQQNQAVRVSYQDVSASNDADTLQDLAGNDVGNFSAQVVSNVTADTTAPTLKVATVQGNRLIVRFSEALLQALKPLASDFTVKVAGTAVAVSKVVFNDSSSLLLTLASAVSAGQTVSMGYSVASDTTVAVQDLAGNASSGFTNASVVNLASVAAAPGLRSVTANGNVLTLKFDGTLRYTLNDASAFLVTVNNTPVTISSVSVVGTSVLLYLASAVTSEQSVEVSYTAPQQASDTTTLRDWLGNGVGNLSAQVATNITGQDLTAPTLQYAIVNGNSLVLTFSEALNGQAGFTPVPSAFAVHVAGSAVAVTQAVVSGATVTLSLATAVDYAAAVSLSYTDLSASNDVAVVQDLAGNDAASFSNINVVNNTPNTTAPSLLSATVTENQLVLLFDDPLNNNAGYLPPLTSMSVNAAGVAVGIVSGSLNGDTATLTLSRAVNADDYVTFNYSAPASSSSTQAFQDWSGNPLLSIANFSVSNLTGVDLTPPSVVSAEVNGNTLSLTFSESLASTASFTPGLNAFSVYVDGALNTVSALTLNGKQAVLSLNRAVSKEQVVTVSYSQPANRPIQDGAGNFATSFSGKAVSNVTVDTSAPTLSSASVAGALLTLTFNENLATDTSLIPSAKQFAVNVDGAVVDVLSAVVAGKVVTVTLNKAVTATQAVSVDYTPATTGTNQLQDASGNATVRFSKTVSNWSGLASLQNATVSGTQLTLTFNQELDAISGHLPPVSAFAVQVAGVNSTVSQLVVNGYTLTLTLDTAVNYGQEVTVNYTDPSTANDVAALQNLTGMDVQTFSEAYTAHNLTPPVADVLAPSLNSAVANGNTVTLTFSEALDAGVGEWLVNYLPDGQYDAQGNPVVTSRLQASGFVNVLGSNSNDSFIIGDQSGLAASRQLNYIQLGNGQGVKVSHYDTSGNLLLAMGSTGQADVVLESGSSLQKLLTTKLVQSDADIVKYKAHRDTVTLKSLSSLTAFLAGYEFIDATESSSSLTAQIGGGDHQIKLGGQTVNLQFDKVVSNTSITTKLIPNSWLDYQYFNFNSINADGLWVGRESDGTVLFHAQWAGSDSATTEHLSVNYDGTLSNVVMGVGHVVASAASSQLRLDKLIEVMSSSAFSTDPTAASKAIAVTDTSNDGAQTKLYRVSDIVAYSAQPQSAVTGGV